MRKPIFHFLAIGFLLFVGTRMIASAEVAPAAVIEIDAAKVAELRDGWVRRVGSEPSPAQLEALLGQTIDDEILFREAIAAGLVQIDSVVARRLLQNVRFLGLEEASDAELLEQAYALDMHLTDPVVRRRLIQLMRSAIFAAARAENVADEEQQLRERYAANQQQFLIAPRRRISHVFIGRDRQDGEEARALALREQIESQQLSVEQAIELGDPFLRGHRLALLSQRELEGYFGPQLAAAVFELEPGVWSQPIESAYGMHLVWIDESRAARQPDFEEVRERVRDDWQRDREQARLRRVLDELRGGYEIRVADVPGDAAS